MREFVVELIGTFFLVLTIGLVGLEDLGHFGPLAIGFTLMALIFAGGHLSGAHYNPAATFAIWLRGRCATRDLPTYLAAELLGGLLGALTVSFFAGPGGAAFEAVRLPLPTLMVAEALFTFALCWVILNVGFARSTEGNSFYGLAIGLIVIGGAYAVGPISSAVFNPAVAVALAALGALPWATLWAYFAAQLTGAAVAAFAFKAVHGP